MLHNLQRIADLELEAASIGLSEQEPHSGKEQNGRQNVSRRLLRHPAQARRCAKDSSHERCDSVDNRA
jgi:hypothetical protein